MGFCGQNPFSPFEIGHCLWCGGVVRLHDVRKWCAEIESGGLDIHDDNRTSRPTGSVIDVNVVQLILEDLCVKI